MCLLYTSTGAEWEGLYAVLYATKHYKHVSSHKFAGINKKVPADIAHEVCFRPTAIMLRITGETLRLVKLANTNSLYYNVQ